MTNSLSVKALLLFRDTTTHTLTMKSGSVFTVSDQLKLVHANLTLGSPTGDDVTASANFASDDPATRSTLSDSTITNYGRLTFTGLSFGHGHGPSSIINGSSGTFEVKNTSFSYYGTLTNHGTLKFNATAISINPEFTNLGTVQVYPGTVDFKKEVIQTGGEFQIRDATVKVSEGTETLAITDGALTGKGSINANVTMGAAPVMINGSLVYPICFPRLRPGLIDSDNPTAMATGTIAITKNFTILSTWAKVYFEVKDATSYDNVTVDGTATLLGTANITAAGDYKPAAGTQRELIVAAVSLTGSFDTVSLTRDPWLWTTTNDGNAGRDHYWESLYFPGGKRFGIQVQLGPLVVDEDPPPPPPGP